MDRGEEGRSLEDVPPPKRAEDSVAEQRCGNGYSGHHKSSHGRERLRGKDERDGSVHSSKSKDSTAREERDRPMHKNSHHVSSHQNHHHHHRGRATQEPIPAADTEEALQQEGVKHPRIESHRREGREQQQQQQQQDRCRQQSRDEQRRHSRSRSRSRSRSSDRKSRSAKPSPEPSRADDGEPHSAACAEVGSTDGHVAHGSTHGERLRSQQSVGGPEGHTPKHGSETSHQKEGYRPQPPTDSNGAVQRNGGHQPSRCSPDHGAAGEHPSKGTAEQSEGTAGGSYSGSDRERRVQYKFNERGGEGSTDDNKQASGGLNDTSVAGNGVGRVVRAGAGAPAASEAAGSGAGEASTAPASAAATSADRVEVRKASASAPSATAAPAAGAGGGGKATASVASAAPRQKRLLSFEDEETEEGGGSGSNKAAAAFSLSASTASRFQQERAAKPLPLPTDSFFQPTLWTPSRLASALGAVPSAAPSLGGVRPCNGMKLGGATDDDNMPRSASSMGHGQVLGHVVFGVASARNVRPYMEDRHTIVQSLRPLSITGQPINDGIERSFASVYDGHNGSRSAEFAASRLHMAFAADPALRAHTGCLGPPAMMAAEEEAISAALRRAFRDIDELILQSARADGGRDGSTALVVTRLGDTLYSAWAGDSRAVISRDGIAERLTEDHKPQLPQERSRVEANGGRVEFQRCWRVIVQPREGRPGSGLAVSRSFGDIDFKEPRRFVESEPEVKRLVPRPGDSFVVLASDGLWDVLSDQEAVDCVGAVLKGCDGWADGNLTSTDAKVASEALLDMSIKRGTVDNVTVVLMLLHWV